MNFHFGHRPNDLLDLNLWDFNHLLHDGDLGYFHNRLHSLDLDLGDMSDHFMNDLLRDMFHHLLDLNLRNFHHLLHRADLWHLHYFLLDLDLDLGDLLHNFLDFHLGDCLHDLLNPNFRHLHHLLHKVHFWHLNDFFCDLVLHFWYLTTNLMKLWSADSSHHLLSQNLSSMFPKACMRSVEEALCPGLHGVAAGVRRTKGTSVRRRGFGEACIGRRRLPGSAGHGRGRPAATP
mmetsp:Transcript_78382/g.162845  ORF Transcript_78382/g.162845 Transcript_78382/m.162845 type:complete len:233 (+) Transcript_78382:2103-2801(+)